MQPKNKETAVRSLQTEAGINFSLAAILPVLLSFVVVMLFQAFAGKEYAATNAYRYTAYLLPQICFAASAFVFFRRSGMPVRKVYHKANWKYFVLAVSLSFGLFSLSELNNLFIGIFEWMGYTSGAASHLPVSGWYIVPALFVIAVLPAIFEETVFRGIQVGVMRQEGWGTAATVLISGALFALFHGNPEQTIYQFACGACYALLAVRSGSVFPTMLAHFLNNAAVIVLFACGVADFPTVAKPYIYAIAGVVLITVLTYLIFWDNRNAEVGGVRGGKKFFLAAGVGIAICAVEWVAVLIQGFAL